jgi:hypothetical protein
MRDESWTAHDLIEQYERICAIFDKANENKNLENDRKQLLQAEKFAMLKKEKKDKLEIYQNILKGDLQRTKNILMNYPELLRAFAGKHSSEILKDIEKKVYFIRQSYDRYRSELEKLKLDYERRLVRQ